MIARFTERSDVRIRYLDNAPPQPLGLPIVFSPGFTDFADDYRDVLDFFIPRRVVVVEVRGRGGSATPAGGYAAADHAADLRAVLDEEGIDRFHLMTFSRGTTWGLDVALAEPGRVASVSLGDYPPRELVVDAAQAPAVALTSFRGTRLGERVDPHVIEGVFAASADRDLYGALADSGLPVLVATGTRPSCMLGAADIDELRRRVPGVEIVVFEGAGHDLFRNDVLAYPRAVQAFIARVGDDR